MRQDSAANTPAPRPGIDLTVPYMGSSRPYAEARGQYRLCLKLATGSTGTIYLAMFRGTDGLQRAVAVKRIHPYLANRIESVEAFFDEAQLAATVSHPAVCALYDFGRSKDTYFLAMEYLVGETFERVIRHMKTLSDGTMLARMPHYVSRLAADVCEGLYAVHQASDTSGQSLRCVHGDITPRNLFALYDGSVRITDFGSAHSRERAREGSTGLGKGKVAYMSPEQLAHKTVDHRSDIWSFGVVLWEMLTQQPLFGSDNVSTTVQLVQKMTVPPPSQKHPFVPVDLDAVVLKALQRDPSARYASARDMALDLEAYLSRSKDTVPACDVNFWLERMFPGESERRRSLAHQARTMVEPSRPSVPSRADTGGTPKLPAKAAKPANSNDKPVEAAKPPPAPDRRKWQMAAGALLLVIVLAALAVFMSSGSTAGHAP